MGKEPAAHSRVEKVVPAQPRNLADERRLRLCMREKMNWSPASRLPSQGSACLLPPLRVERAHDHWRFHLHDGDNK